MLYNIIVTLCHTLKKTSGVESRNILERLLLDATSGDAVCVEISGLANCCLLILQQGNEEKNNIQGKPSRSCLKQIHVKRLKTEEWLHIHSQFMFSAFNTPRPCGPNDQRTLWKVSVSYVTPSNPSSPPRQPIPFKIDLCMLHPHCPTSANNPEKKSSPIAKNPCHQNFNCHQSSSHIMCMHLLMNIAPQSIPLISLLMCHPPLATASSTVVDQR